MTDNIGIKITAEYDGTGIEHANRGLDQFEQSLRSAGDSSQKLERDARALAEAFHDNLAGAYANALANIDELSEQQTRLVTIQRELAEAQDAVNEAFNRLSAASLDEDIVALERAYYDASIALGKLQGEAKFLGVLEDDANDAAQGADRLEASLEDATDATREAGDATQTLGQRLRNSVENYEKLSATSIALKGEWKRLNQEGKLTLEQMERLSREINEAEKAEYAAIVQTRILANEMRGMGDGAEFSNRTLQALDKQLNNSERYITGLGNAEKQVINNTVRMANSLTDMKHDMRETKEATIGLTDKIEALGVRLGGWAQKALTGLWIGLADRALQAVGDVFRNAVQWMKDANEELVQFDSQLRQVYTLTPNLSKTMRRSLQADLLTIGDEIGRLTDETLPAFYQALSLGSDQDSALGEVALSSEAARAGAADLMQTLTLGKSVVNAYGKEVYSLERVYDLLFYGVKNGAVTMNDMLNGMNEITSVAGESGVALEDVVAAIITMTRQGDSFGEVTGLMSNMLTQLQISGTALGGAFREAAGTDFRTFIEEGGNLAGALQILDDHARLTGQSLAEMVGGDSNFYRDQQAMRAVLELTGKHLQTFTQFSEDAYVSQGAMAEAAEQVSDSLEVQQARTDASVERLKILVAEGIRPSKEAWLEFKGAVASGLGDMVAQSNEARNLKDELQELGLATMQIREIEAAVFAGGGDLEMQMRRNAIAVELIADGYDLAALNAGQFAYAIDQVIQAQDAQTAATAAAVEAGRAMEASDAQLMARYQEGFNQVAETAAGLYDVLRTLDGDTVTIMIDGELQDIRFRNINAPEIAHGDEAAMPFAYEAMASVEAFFADNPLELPIALDTDDYGRILADIPELERHLVGSGLALPLPVELTGSEDEFRKFTNLAREAAQAGRGMFADEALAAAYLAGEVSNLNVYYADLIAHQQGLVSHFNAAEEPVSRLTNAMGALNEVPHWDAAGITAAKQEFTTARESIVEDLQIIAYESYLAQNGVNETTIAFGVAAGIFTEEEGKRRLAFAETSLAIESLIEDQHLLKLSDEELLEATRLLAQGMAASPAEAARMAQGFDPLKQALDETGEKARTARSRLKELEGDYFANFTTTFTEVHKSSDKGDDTTTPTPAPAPAPEQPVAPSPSPGPAPSNRTASVVVQSLSVTVNAETSDPENVAHAAHQGTRNALASALREAGVLL